MSTLDTLFNQLENILMAIAALDFDSIEGMPRDEKRLYRAALVLRKEYIQEAIDKAYEISESAGAV